MILEKFSSIYKIEVKSMTSRNQNKTIVKTACYISEPNQSNEHVSHEDYETQVVSFQTHSQKMDLNKQEQNELFHKVLSFLNQLINNKNLWSELHERMNKYIKSSERLSSQKKNDKRLSFKKLSFGSKIFFDAEPTTKNDQPNVKEAPCRGGRGNNKKISILINEENFSPLSQQTLSDDFISQNSVRTIRSIEIPHLQMSLETIALIYDTPQPFLITLSLCIFTRYCFNSKRKVKFEESAWILCVSTVIAYKLYYDEEVEGLIDCFTEIMKITKQDLIDLERCFLDEIDYATVIKNYDYHFLMSKLLSMPVESEKNTV